MPFFGLFLQGRQKLFSSLLRVYLVRGSGFSQQAIELLNSAAVDLDLQEVLGMLPPEWSVGVVETFIRRSFRRTMHEQRMLKARARGHCDVCGI